jgi:hypothetical protein
LLPSFFVPGIFTLKRTDRRFDFEEMILLWLLRRRRSSRASREKYPEAAQAQTAAKTTIHNKSQCFSDMLEY